MTARELFTGASASVEANYIEDVFSTYLYTGNSSTQTITNGIDLSTKGGLVWLKGRSGATDHALYDTVRGATYDLVSNLTAAQTTQSTGLTSFGTTGFTIGSLAKLNTSAATYTSFTFRKQPKFFDIVTYTGNGTAGRAISHSLGSTPGMIIVKSTSASGAWTVYHRSLTSAAYALYLNVTGAQDNDNTNWNSTAPTSSVFTVGSGATNTNGATYVAYLFAHDAGGFGASGTDSVVSCGSYTGTGASGLNVTTGWEPQYILIKRVNDVGPWNVFDNMRGISYSTTSYLYANTSGTEVNGLPAIVPTSTGFSFIRADTDYNGASSTYIYLAIRRGPMKTPTDATKVFSPITSSAAAGTAQTTSFPVDSQWKAKRATDTLNASIDDRLRGVSTTTTASGNYLITSSTAAQATTNATTQAFDNVSFKNPTYYGGASSIYWSFRRAPGFFDVVCYTGTGSLPGVTHTLGVTPELKIIKRRSAVSEWIVGGSLLGSGAYACLNTTAAKVTLSGYWDGGSDSATQFSVRNTNAASDVSGSTYVAYLFATCPGVSKVGSYTGSGTTKQIDCGFTNGARFVLIKRTDSTGDWYVWDTARGIVSSTDPYLLLNSTAAEVTNTDYIDPYSAGFEISSSAPAAINASGGSYIYLAIA